MISEISPVCRQVDHASLARLGPLTTFQDSSAAVLSRLGEGGCTAVLDRAGAHVGLERVGDLLYQAPEVQRPCPGSKLAYTAAGACPPLMRSRPRTTNCAVCRERQTWRTSAAHMSALRSLL